MIFGVVKVKGITCMNHVVPFDVLMILRFEIKKTMFAKMLYHLAFYTILGKLENNYHMHKSWF